MERNFVMEKNYDAFFDKLKRVGVNTDKTIDRFGGLDELYVKFLDEFADTERFEEIYAALSGGDNAKAEMCSHKLKGVLGNLGMDELFSEAELVMKELRSGSTAEAEQRLRGMQPKIVEIQRVIKETPHE
ncbi:MAG: Hpt domain-containing protein [Oscillospiraceae bacterium]